LPENIHPSSSLWHQLSGQTAGPHNKERITNQNMSSESDASDSNTPEPKETAPSRKVDKSTKKTETTAKSIHEELERSKTTLFIRNLPFDVDSKALSDHFSNFGPLRAAFVVKDDKNVGLSKGIGFVTFAIEQDAASCLEKLHGKPFASDKPRKLKIEFAVAKKIVRKNKESGDAISIPHQVKAQKTRRHLPITVIRIEGLGKDVTKKNLYKKVRKYGNLAESTSIQLENQVAWVTFSTLKEAEAAMKHLDGHIFKGNTITAKVDGEKSLEAKSQYVPSASTTLEKWIKKNPRVIVRNLHFSTGEKHLRKLFNIDDSKITQIHAPTNDKGTGSGFAFVTFANTQQAKIAMKECNGKMLLGRPVAVDWALPKELWEQVKTEEEAEEVEEEEEEVVGIEEDEVIASQQGDSDNSDAQFESDDEQIGVIDVSDAEVSDQEVPEKDVDDETTLFIRNIPYTVTDTALYGKFTAFGPCRYARVVMDHVTQQPRGTGFVRFWKAGDRQRCLQEYATAVKEVDAQKKEERLSKDKKKSILLAEPSLTASTTPFYLDGRFLHILPYVAAADASALSAQHKQDRRIKDKRNLYLMREGVIFPEMPAARSLTALEVEKRVEAYNQRRTLLSKNPNLFVSKTRVSIRNLWLKVDDGQLKQICRNAIDSFWKEVESGDREPLEVDALDEVENKKGNVRPFTKAPIKQVKIMRDTDRMDPETGKARSRGFAFVEFIRHIDALCCLRWLNNNPRAYDVLEAEVNAKKRPIVEFAMENTLVIKKRGERRPNDVKRKRDGQDSDRPAKKQKVSNHHEKWNQSSKRKGEGVEEEPKPKRVKTDAKSTQDDRKKERPVLAVKPSKMSEVPKEKPQEKPREKPKEKSNRSRGSKEKRDDTDSIIDGYKKKLVGSQKWTI
jgi:nucleolar protein 4